MICKVTDVAPHNKSVSPKYPTPRNSHTSLWPPPLQVLLCCFSRLPGRCWHPLSSWCSATSCSLKIPRWPGDPGWCSADGSMIDDLLWHRQVWALALVPRCCGPGCLSSGVLQRLSPASDSSADPAPASLCGPGHPVGCSLPPLQRRRLRCQPNLGMNGWTSASGAWGSASRQSPSSPTQTSSSGFGDEGDGTWSPQKHGEQRREMPWFQSSLTIMCLSSSVIVSLLSWPPPPPSITPPLFFWWRWKAVLCSFCSCAWEYYPPSNSPSLSFSLSFPPVLLLFLFAAAAAAAVPLELS